MKIKLYSFLKRGFFLHYTSVDFTLQRDKQTISAESSIIFGEVPKAYKYLALCSRVGISRTLLIYCTAGICCGKAITIPFFVSCIV